MPKTHYTLTELSQHLGAELRGDPECLVHSIASLEKAGAGQLSYLYDPKYRKYLTTSAAAALILSQKDAKDWSGNALIVPNPYLAYAKTASLFDKKPTPKPGVHPTAVIGEHCQIAPSASVGAHCVLGDNVHIGEHTVIHSGCSIGSYSTIGANSCLYSNVTLYHDVHVGNDSMIHSGAVVGADGFGMVNDNGEWVKIPQLGKVMIGNAVEIGANTTIDRGALDDTVIEDGVKLDNQIQVGHNTVIGAYTAIAGATAIAGSVKIGKHCMIAGACAINGHIEIADETIITGMSGVLSSIAEAGIYSAGLPIQPHRQWKKSIVRLMQLDDIARRVKKMEQSEGHKK